MIMVVTPLCIVLIASNIMMYNNKTLPPAEIGLCPGVRGSKSRNKVAVGEPAAGSLAVIM